MMGDGPGCPEKGADLLGNRRFESTSLQWGVNCEPVRAGGIQPGDPLRGSRKAGKMSARPHVRLSTGRPVSQYAGNEGCAGLAGAEPHA